MRFSLFFLYAALAILLSPAYAQQSETPAGKLAVKPRLCIVKNGEETCDIDVQLSWQADAVLEYCVFKRGSNEPLQCWQAEASGEVFDTLQADADVIYRLLWQTQQLDEATFRVVSVVPEDRRRQRGRRHIWSVF